MAATNERKPQEHRDRRGAQRTESQSGRNRQGVSALQDWQLVAQRLREELQAVHAATHPGAKLERAAKAAAGPEEAREEELLSALAAEAADE